jgi:uncharacterized protein (DUF1778 family)
MVDKGRDARLELRLTPKEKADLTKAASIGGEDVSSFIRRVALTEARKLLEKKY